MAVFDDQSLCMFMYHVGLSHPDINLGVWLRFFKKSTPREWPRKNVWIVL